MIGIVIYGAAGFVASTLLNGSGLPPCALTLVDRERIDLRLLESPGIAGAPIHVIRSSSLADSVIDEADVLLVLAGQTDVNQALANPAMAFEANMTIAIESAECGDGIRRPDSSTCHLTRFSAPRDFPWMRKRRFGPTQPYAASKAAAEMTLRCYSDSYRLDLVIIRSCNLVGGRQRARKLIPTAVQNLAANLPVPIYGDGSHQREYLAVEDLCEVILRAVTRSLPAGIYNCTSGIALQTIEVVKIIAETLGVEPAMVKVEDRLVHDRCYAMDASKLEAHGWKPQVPPTDAIAAVAIELKSAWDDGQILTHRAGS